MNPFKKYGEEYSENKLWDKFKNFAKAAGAKVVYAALLLFYAYQRKETPTWAKNIVLGTLGYLISPIDAIPDLSPIIGYTDDLGVLSFGLVTISAYINKEVKENAKEKLTKWFGAVSKKDLEDVEKHL